MEMPCFYWRGRGGGGLGHAKLFFTLQFFLYWESTFLCTSSNTIKMISLVSWELPLLSLSLLPSYLRNLFSRSASSVRFRVTSSRMCLPFQISVRLPSVIDFTWLLFIFGTLFLILIAPHPKSGSSRIVFSGTYLTSIMILLDGQDRPGLISCLAVFCCCHRTLLIMYTIFITRFCDLFYFYECIVLIIIFSNIVLYFSSFILFFWNIIPYILYIIFFIIVTYFCNCILLFLFLVFYFWSQGLNMA